ncbi:MAG: cytochrome C [Gallionella sp.]
MIIRIWINALLVFGIALACITPACADSVNDLLMPGPVIEGHAKHESDCASCHKQFDKLAQSGLCKDCHKEIKKDLAEKRGYHGLMKEEKECKECHTEHRGRDAKIAKLETKNFDHALTGFVLKGGHLKEKVQCKDCHLPHKTFHDAPATCNACHKKDDKHKGSLGAECANCHEEKDWKSTHFDHSKTHFALNGKHIDVKCAKCHIDEKYKDTPLECNACHKKDDKHKGNFGAKCESCHVDRNWKEITFDHDKKTKYPLLGKHHEVKCISCHQGELYKEKLKMDCLACHKKDDKHKGSFGPKCESCHTERGWKEVLFDHGRKTKFPLTGKHHEVKCSACHKGDLYNDKLKMDCLSCHLKDDKHKNSFGPKCESCHVDRGWKEIIFDHDKKTKYPLLGKHHEAKCVACHKGDLYKDKLKTDCFSCHEKDDKHKGQEGKKCESCHHEQSWKKTEFDHRMSHFPLTGRHLVTDCKKCHLAPTYKDTKSDCWSCHEKQDAHKRTLGKDCETCHNTRDWKNWDFDHDKTKFKLEGKHKGIRCAECHNTPVNKVNLAVSCGGCHSKDDKHDGAFGDKCEHCHTGTSWKTITVDSKIWMKH